MLRPVSYEDRSGGLVCRQSFSADFRHFRLFIISVYHSFFNYATLEYGKHAIIVTEQA